MVSQKQLANEQDCKYRTTQAVNLRIHSAKSWYFANAFEMTVGKICLLFAVGEDQRGSMKLVH